ncbi:UNVERIFIED_CONTAM: hypothetical protein Scaly_0342600 [Sesamum calycinum]|uniref:B3 domain-containing protein n=1 Tax=Sesamum calycinum TaxID=2727403 RepID=A0AAW2SBB6_9LAMI
MEKMDKIRLFGQDVCVPRRDDRPVQQSDQRDDQQVVAAAADDHHDHVDTTLRLVVGGPVPRNMDRRRVCNPVPFQSFHPSMALDSSLQFGGDKPGEKPSEEALSLTLGVPGSNDGKRGEVLKRKQKSVAAEERKGKSVKRKRSADEELEPAIPLLEEIPRLLETIQTSNGTNPVFLYRKRLQHSDVRADQNRLFLTRCEKLMEFLTEEERNTATGRKEGLEIFAVDSHERESSYKLHLAKWPSLTMMVINSDWKKMVKKSNASAGDWVEIWGYRRNGQLRFAVNFRGSGAAEAHHDQSNAAGASTNNQGIGIGIGTSTT